LFGVLFRFKIRIKHVKNNSKTNEIKQAGLYWLEKRIEGQRITLHFQTVEVITESKAERDELTLFRQRGEPAPDWRYTLIRGDMRSRQVTGNRKQVQE